MTQKPRVLIIDDDAANRELIDVLFCRENIIPLFAEDGTTGLKKAAEEIPDLILLDIFMPKEDGFDVLFRLKQNQNLRRIPIVIFTILEQEESRKKAMEMGAADYVTKPFDIKKTLDIVKKYLP